MQEPVQAGTRPIKLGTRWHKVGSGCTMPVKIVSRHIERKDEPLTVQETPPPGEEWGQNACPESFLERLTYS